MSKYPLSPYKLVGNTLFISGQIGQQNGQLVSDDLEQQIIQTVNNIKAILNQNGMELRNVLDVTAFLVEQEDYVSFNEVYAKLFPEPYPTRTTVMVKSLPLNAKVELKVIASK